jgi:hypothetical protein
MMPLIDEMHRLRRRLTLLMLGDCAARALFAAACASCVWLVLTRLFPQLGGPLPVSVALSAGGVLGAAFWTSRRAPALEDAALAADARLGLKERLTSSLALRRDDASFLGGSPEMAEAVHEDAGRHLARLNLRRDFPFRVTRGMRWLAAPLILFGLGLLLLPEFDLLGHRDRVAQARAQAQALQAQAELLERAARLWPEPADAEAGEAEPVTQGLERLAGALQRGEITEKQALAQVARLADRLREQRQALARQARSASPRPAGLRHTREAARALEQGRPADAAKALAALQEKVARGELSAREMRELGQELGQLAAQLGGREAPERLASALEQAENEGASPDAGLCAALESMELSARDMASALEQLARMDAALLQLGEWRKKTSGGESLFCQTCGAGLKPGECEGGQCGACQGHGVLRPANSSRPGWGRGNAVGEMDDAGDTEFTPALLPGSLREGKLLLETLERVTPEAGEGTPSVSVEAFIAVRQQAEQALGKEEIPPGSREFVRQYFGALESPAAQDE